MAGQRNHPKGKYAVHYDSRNHLSVMTQMYGSVWSDIWPYCLFNVGLVLLDYYWLDSVFGRWGIVVTDKGHTISVFFVAFLVVTRVNMALGRYNMARTNLGTMLAKTRDLISSAAVFTKGDQSQSAKEWRAELAYYTCLLLRLSMAVFDYDEDKIAPWTLPELQGDIKSEILKGNQITGETKRWAHDERTVEEEVYRVPVTMSVHLRCKLQDCEGLKKPVPPPMLGRFNGIVDAYMGAFNGQRKLYTTPLPFPLVQMARTMMFMWVFTLPFAIDSDDSTLLVHCVVVFLLTYAFMGIETVSLQLDDPFGRDENDFDNLGLAKVEFEDVYNLINVVDGPEWADRVRGKMQGVRDSISVAATETTPLV